MSVFSPVGRINSRTYFHSNNPYDVIIPPHQGDMIIDVWGGTGAPGGPSGFYPFFDYNNGSGGGGGRISLLVNFPPGTVFQFQSGENGSLTVTHRTVVNEIIFDPYDPHPIDYAGGVGGPRAFYTDYSPGTIYSGDGGSASIVSLNGTPIIVAGGGGGGAMASQVGSDGYPYPGLGIVGFHGGRGGMGMSAGSSGAGFAGGEGGGLVAPGTGGAGGGLSGVGHIGGSTGTYGGGGGGGYYGGGGGGGGVYAIPHDHNVPYLHPETITGPCAGGGGSSWYSIPDLGNTEVDTFPFVGNLSCQHFVTEFATWNGQEQNPGPQWGPGGELRLYWDDAPGGWQIGSIGIGPSVGVR